MSDCKEYDLAELLVSKCFTKEMNCGKVMRNVSTIKYLSESFYLYSDKDVWVRHSKEDVELRYMLPLLKTAGELSSSGLGLSSVRLLARATSPVAVDTSIGVSCRTVL